MIIPEFSEVEKSNYFFQKKPCKAIFGFVACILAIFVVGIIWLCFANLDDTITANVVLRPAETVSSVRTQCSGKIREICFVNNQIVNKGDILFFLDTTSLEKELEKIEELINKNKKELKIQRTLIEVIMSNSLKEIDEKTEEYFRAASYLAESSRLRKEADDAEIKYNRELTKPELFTTKQNIDDLKSLAEQRRLIFETYVQDSMYKCTENIEMLESSQILLKKDADRINTEIKKAIIIAPISGTILEIRKLNVGDNIFSSEEVLQIVPLSTNRLKAEIYVLTSDVARIEKNNFVRIKLAGLSPARFGYVEAQITVVPPDYIISSNGDLLFVVEANIEKMNLSTRSGETILLKPGLSGQAKIVVGHSKAYVMLLKKLDFLW